MAVTVGQNFGKRLADVLGLPLGFMVRAIDVRVDEVVKAHIETYLTEEQAQKLLDEFQDVKPEIVLHHIDR